MRRAASHAAPQRFEHGLAAQRHRLDRRGAVGDAQHADDVEAAAARAGHRARAPERGGRRLGEDRVGEPAVAGRCGRRRARRRAHARRRRSARAARARRRGRSAPSPRRARSPTARIALGGGADRLDDLGEPVGLGRAPRAGPRRSCTRRPSRSEPRATSSSASMAARAPATSPAVSSASQRARWSAAATSPSGSLDAVERLERHAVEVAGLLVGEPLHRAVGGARGTRRRPCPRCPSDAHSNQWYARSARRASGSPAIGGAPRAARRSCGAAGPASASRARPAAPGGRARARTGSGPGVPAPRRRGRRCSASAISSTSSAPRTCSTSARSKRRPDDRGHRRARRWRASDEARQPPAGGLPHAFGQRARLPSAARSPRRGAAPRSGRTGCRTVTSASSRPRARSVLPTAAR